MFAPDHIFPVPLKFGNESIVLPLSRGCRQRVARRLHRCSRIDGVIASLNWCSGHHSPDPQREVLRVHEEIHARAARCVDDRPVPAGCLKPDEALRALLRAKSGYDVAGTRVATYRRGAVSLPSGVSDAPLASDLGCETARLYLTEFRERMLRPGDKVEIAAEADKVKPYMDVVLGRSRRGYVEFVRDLDQRGLVNWVTDPLAECTIFFVDKKDGRLRMIIDCRRANVHFDDPPGVSLCSAEGLSRIELGEEWNEGFEVWGGIADVKDCFYRMKIPHELSRYFCLPPITRREAGLGDDDSLVWPGIAVLPMGFSWSLFLAQLINEDVVVTTPLMGGTQKLVDRGEPCVLTGEGEGWRRSFYVYVDNLGILGLSEKAVRSSLSRCVTNFEQRGLEMHDIEVSNKSVDALGVELRLEERRTRLADKRYWRLAIGLDYLLKLRSVSGDMVECILGHCTAAGMVCRETICVFHAAYKFARVCRGTFVRLWPTVREELEAFLGLMPLLEADWTRSWDPVVSAYDSSSYAYGVTTAVWDPAVVASTGRVPERGRFRLVGQLAARRAALQSAGEAWAAMTLEDDAVEFESEVERDRRGSSAGCQTVAGFPEVPASQLFASSWKTVICARWDHAEAIHLLEARAGIAALERLARTSYGSSRRRLFLGDNMSVTLAFERCRAQNFDMLKLVRKKCALVMARNLSVAWRWIASETNPADAPSRLAPLQPFDPSCVKDFAQCKDFSLHSIASVGPPGLLGPLVDHQPDASQTTAMSFARAEPVGDEWGGRAEAVEEENLGAGSGPARAVGADRASCESEAPARRAAGPRTGSPARIDDTHTLVGGDNRGGEVGGDGQRLVGKFRAGSPARLDPSRTAAGVPSRVAAPRVVGAGRLLLGDGECGAAVADGVQAGLGDLRARTGAYGLEVDLGYGAGREAGELCGQALLRGSGAARWPATLGRSWLGSPALWTFGHGPVAADLTGAQGLAAALPASVSNPFVVADGSGHRSVLDKGPPSADGSLGALDLCSLLAAVGVHGTVERGFGATDSQHHGLLDADRVPAGTRGTHEDRRCRRQRLARLRAAALAGRSARGAGRSAARSQGVGLHVPRVGGAVPSGGVAGRRCRRAIPAAPLGAQLGSVEEPTVVGGDPKARPLGELRVGTALREARAGGEGSVVDARRRAQLPRSLHHGARGCRARPNRLPTSPAAVKGRWFADVCSGEGGVAKAVRAKGFRTAEWDTRHGAAYDVAAPRNRRAIAADVSAGRILGLMLAPPCSSFSLARTRNSVVRTREEPWGVAGLDERLQQQVDDGNRIMRACISLLTLCAKKGVPAALEQPATSYALKTPEVLSLLERGVVTAIVVDFCAYGTAWRKRTCLLVCNVDADDLGRFQRRTCGGARGICGHTGVGHFELAGRNDKNILWTQLAQPYPKGLCADLAFILTEGERAKRCH